MGFGTIDRPVLEIVTEVLLMALRFEAAAIWWDENAVVVA
jgi:hypothetical protein